MAARFDPDPIDIAVGLRLRSLRKEKGLSQSELGERLGVTFQQVQKYERATNRISASMMVRAARALSVAVAQLLPEAEQDLDGATAISNLLTHMRGAEALIQSYARIPSARHRRAVLELARVMAAEAADPELDDG